MLSTQNMCKNWWVRKYLQVHAEYFGLILTYEPGPLALSVTGLTAGPGTASSIPARSHTFVEMGYEIISTAILLLPLIQEELLSAISESMYEKYRL